MPNSSVANSFTNVIDTRLRYYASDYARASAPRSPHPLLTGNSSPNTSRLSWLRDRAKCNQFVGDILTDAGYAMPLYRMRDGSSHYVNAEALPKFRQHFAPVHSLNQLRAGDLIVEDNLSHQGENGAHVEVVRAIDSTQFESAGAHHNGANTSVRPLNSLGEYEPESGSFLRAGVRTWLLRPQQLLPDY